jgi:hypothetical protein
MGKRETLVFSPRVLYKRHKQSRSWQPRSRNSPQTQYIERINGIFCIRIGYISAAGLLVRRSSWQGHSRCQMPSFTSDRQRRFLRQQPCAVQTSLVQVLVDPTNCLLEGERGRDQNHASISSCQNQACSPHDNQPRWRQELLPNEGCQHGPAIGRR